MIQWLLLALVLWYLWNVGDKEGSSSSKGISQAETSQGSYQVGPWNQSSYAGRAEHRRGFEIASNRP